MSKKKNKKNKKKIVENPKEEFSDLKNDVSNEIENSEKDLKSEISNELDDIDKDSSISDGNSEDVDNNIEGSGGNAAGVGGGNEPPKKSGGGIAGFWNDRSPVLRFVILFALFMGIFYAIWATQWFHDVIVKNVTTLDAKIASIFLNLFGYNTLAEGTSVASEKITVNVKTGCDGIEAMALFVSGVTAYTAPRGYKIKGIIMGVSFLFFMNLVRIIHLWLSGYYMPEYFEFFHQNFWQIVFIFLSIITWALWINRINKNSKKASNA